MMLPVSVPPLSLHQQVRVGLIVNPFSRANRNSSWLQDAITYLGRRAVVCTRSIDEIPEALMRLFVEEKINTLAISGGDGTIHHVVNALQAMFSPQDKRAGMLALPPLLLLRGGTLNIVARAIHTRGTPKRVLLRLLRRHRQSTLRELELVQQPVIGVRSQFWGERYGFVFGSALTARCLELYEDDYGAGYLGLLTFLREAVRGYFFQTPLWEENKHLLEAPFPRLDLDGDVLRYLAVVASTVDIKIAGGLICGLRVGDLASEGLRLRILHAQTPTEAIWNLSNLVFGRAAKGIEDRVGVRSLRLDGGFSLDGEVYPKPKEGPDALEVFAPSWKIPLVTFPTPL